MKLPKEALHRSCLVVAHPDDEVLWFSSILDQVDAIILCFSDAERWPDLGEARRKSIAGHKYAARIVNLDIAQVKSHNMSAWPSPQETDYGLLLQKQPGFDQPYRRQAEKLETALTPHIQKYENIFTHNPWGEYGHEDHVQVHRVVTRLADANNATVWYDNYVSNKSCSLMRKYMQPFGHEYFAMPVDTQKARETADTYYKHDAWTWLDDYAWFEEECFVAGPLSSANAPGAGVLFPVNMIRVLFDPERASQPAPGLVRRLGRKLRRRLGAVRGKSKDVAAT